MRSATVAANLFVAVGLLWVQLLPPIVLDGQAFPLFDPALWSFWIPWFIVVPLAEVGFAIAALPARALDRGVRRRERPPRSPPSPSRRSGCSSPTCCSTRRWSATWMPPDGTGSHVTLMVTMIVLIVTVGWDAIDGFRKAWRNRRQRGPAGHGA